MEHPDISALNAKLYHTRMMQEATESRRAKLLTVRRKMPNFVASFLERFQFPNRGRAQETLHSST